MKTVSDFIESLKNAWGTLPRRLKVIVGWAVLLLGILFMLVALIPAGLSIYRFVLNQVSYLSHHYIRAIVLFLLALAVTAGGYYLWPVAGRTPPGGAGGNPPGGAGTSAQGLPTSHPLSMGLGVYIIVFSVICVIAILQLLPVELQTAAPAQSPPAEATPIPEAEATLEAGQSSAQGVVNSDQSEGTESNASERFFLLGIAISPDGELRLLLLVLFSGLLGGLLKSLQSYRLYTGEKKLTANWIPFMITQPFIGGGLAVVFYILLRGGLFTPTDFSSVNRLAFVAISGMVGLFSEQAIGKLTKIANSIFDPIEQGSESLADTAPLNAVFTPDKTTGAAPLDVTFDASTSTGVTRYKWDFGDGEFSSEVNPKHTYKTAGTYTVTLMVSDAKGDMKNTREEITVT